MKTLGRALAFVDGGSRLHIEIAPSGAVHTLARFDGDDICESAVMTVQPVSQLV